MSYHIEKEKNRVIDEDEQIPEMTNEELDKYYENLGEDLMKSGPKEEEKVQLIIHDSDEFPDYINNGSSSGKIVSGKKFGEMKQLDIKYAKFFYDIYSNNTTISEKSCVHYALKKTFNNKTYNKRIRELIRRIDSQDYDFTKKEEKSMDDELIELENVVDNDIVKIDNPLTVNILINLLDNIKLNYCLYDCTFNIYKEK